MTPLALTLGEVAAIAAAGIFGLWILYLIAAAIRDWWVGRIEDKLDAILEELRKRPPP